MGKTMIAATLGVCVHVAGITNFLPFAESAGWRTVFLGPAVPKNGEPGGGMGAFAEAADDLHQRGVKLAFGGMPPVADRAQRMGFCWHIFDGSEPHEAVLAYLKSQDSETASKTAFAKDPITGPEAARCRSWASVD